VRGRKKGAGRAKGKEPVNQVFFFWGGGGLLLFVSTA